MKSLLVARRQTRQTQLHPSTGLVAGVEVIAVLLY
jgi:hypothetical protein